MVSLVLRATSQDRPAGMNYAVAPMEMQPDKWQNGSCNNLIHWRSVLMVSYGQRISRRAFLGYGSSLMAGSIAAARAPAAFSTVIRPGGQSVVVATNKVLGQASSLHRFLGTGDGDSGGWGWEEYDENGHYTGTTHRSPEASPALDFENQPILLQRWRELGFKRISFEGLFHPGAAGVRISLNKNTGRYAGADFSNCAQRINYYRSRLGAFVSVIAIDTMPRELSLFPNDDGYFFSYVPARWRDWERFVQDLVRFVKQDMSMPGRLYTIGFEHASWIVFHGTMTEEPSDEEGWRESAQHRLSASAYFFGRTARAIKQIDPQAKLVMPPDGVPPIRKAGYRDQGWLMDEWLSQVRAQGFAQYVDAVAWQNYGGDSLADDIALVRQHLHQAGFSPDTPKVMAGSGSGSWCTDENRHIPSDIRASLTAHNLLTELADPNRTNIMLCDYYTAFGEDLGDDNHHNGILLFSGELDSLRLNRISATFQIFTRSTQGHIVETESQPRSDALRSMAVKNDAAQTITAIVNNHSRISRDMQVIFRDVNTTQQTAQALIQIVARTTREFGGLEPGTAVRVDREKDGSFIAPVQMPPYATASIRLSLRSPLEVQQAPTMRATSAG